MLPFQRRQNIPTQVEAIASDEFEIVEISPRIAKLANVPSRQAHAQPHAHSRVFSLASPTATGDRAERTGPRGERSNIWPGSRKMARPVPPEPSGSDLEADRSVGATVVTNAQAHAITGSTHLAEPPTISWAAGGLVASAILALGILVGVVVTVLGRADTDPNYDATASIANPSPAQTHSGSQAMAGQPLPPQFPVQPPVMVTRPVPPAASNKAFTQSSSGRPVMGRDGVATVSVDSLPRAGATPAPARYTAAPRWTPPPRKNPVRTASPTSAVAAAGSTPAPKAAAPKPTGDPDLDAANRTLAQSKNETEVALH